MNANFALKTALLTLVAATALGVGTNAAAAGDKPMAMAADAGEKCYGINAAHKNDCKAASHSCAGQSAKARDPNSFVKVPAGLCQKIDGGALAPMKS